MNATTLHLTFGPESVSLRPGGKAQIAVASFTDVAAYRMTIRLCESGAISLRCECPSRRLACKHVRVAEDIVRTHADVDAWLMHTPTQAAFQAADHSDAFEGLVA
jgi:hypothetical protein